MKNRFCYFSSLMPAVAPRNSGVFWRFSTGISSVTFCMHPVKDAQVFLSFSASTNMSDMPLPGDEKTSSRQRLTPGDTF